MTASSSKRPLDEQDFRLIWNERVEMRDGVELSTDLYLPTRGGPFPAVLFRTPYQSTYDTHTNWAIQTAARGYAVVIQDSRGKFESEGAFYAYHGEGADGVDTLKWIRAQPWSNGRVGGWGRSYGGLFQWWMAREADGSLTCMAPHANPCDYFSEVAYIGGAFQLLHGLSSAILYITDVPFHHSKAALRLWNNPSFLSRLPLIDLDMAAIGKRIQFWRDWLEHPTLDDYWKSISWVDEYERIDAPVFQHTGWFDPYAGSALRNFTGMTTLAPSERARRGQRVIIGPSTHGEPTGTVQGEIDFGPRAFVDIRKEDLRWYDYWLKDIDTGLQAEAPINLFVMGRNEWRGEHTWPLERATEVAYYLHSGGRANFLDGEGSLEREPPGAQEPDRFFYDPADPVLTVGGNNSTEGISRDMTPVILAGPVDQRSIEGRGDVLVYTTPVLEQDIEVTGPIQLVLYAASSARDTDFTAKLIDVFPDGRSMNLSEGILRARYRNGPTRLELLEPEEPTELRMELNPTSNVFLAGHRIRLDISSSNFPRFSRNLNTGEDVATGTRMEVARQTVLHSTEYPSRVLLPVIPA